MGTSEPSMGTSEPSMGTGEPLIEKSEPSMGMSEPSMGTGELLIETSDASSMEKGESELEKGTPSLLTGRDHRPCLDLEVTFLANRRGVRPSLVGSYPIRPELDSRMRPVQPASSIRHVVQACLGETARVREHSRTVAFVGETTLQTANNTWVWHPHHELRVETW
jgi:hypothetical protein